MAKLESNGAAQLKHSLSAVSDAKVNDDLSFTEEKDEAVLSETAAETARISCFPNRHNKRRGTHPKQKCNRRVALGPWSKVIDAVSSKLAFFPPTPPSYEVKEHADGTGDLYIEPNVPYIQKITDCEVFFVDTEPTRHGGGQTKIVCARVPYQPPGGIKSRIFTLIYSHGNAVDLGQTLPFLKEFSQRLGVHVVGYDYSGYGCSTGSPQVRNTLSDIEAVYKALTEKFETEPEQIILYGQSVGSGPTIYLGSKIPEISGVVLHAPLLSGMRVLNPNLRWWPSWADIYPNYRLMPKIEAHVLVMHGLQDEVIDVSHGKTLYKLAKNAVEPLWPPQSNHQNLEACPQFFPRLREFIFELSHK